MDGNTYFDLVTIDPGKGRSAVACWVDGQLAEAKQVPNDLILSRFPAPIVVCEYPQKYKGRNAVKGGIEDLIRAVSLIQSSPYRASNPIFETCLPRQWKGQVPKTIHHARAEALLTLSELAIWCRADVDHNVRDAITLGLWVLGRIPGPTRYRGAYARSVGRSG